MVQVNVTLTETIKKLLEEKKYSTLKDILTTMMPFDIAAVFSELQSEKTPILFRILPKELAAETFVEMDEDTQEFLIHGFSDSELKEVVDELFVDDAVDIIEECVTYAQWDEQRLLARSVLAPTAAPVAIPETHDGLVGTEFA